MSLISASALTAVLLAASTGTASAQSTSPGSLDTSFGSGGAVVESASLSNGATGVAVVPLGVAAAGDIVTAGSAGTRRFQVGRFTATGALDPSFAGGFADPFLGQAQAVTVIPAGRPNAGDVVAVGYWNTPLHCSNQETPVVAELTPAGALNPSFGSAGVKAIPTAFCGDGLSQLNAVTIDGDGNIVVAGQSTNASATVETLVARLTPAGALDPSFDTSGFDLAPIGSNDSAAYGVTTAGGNIFTSGFSDNGSNQSLLTVASFFGSGPSAGHLNNEFGTGGVVTAATQAGSVAQAITALPNGNVVAVGSTLVSGLPRFFLAQYTPTGGPVTGFGSAGQVIGSPNVNANEELNAVAYEPSGGLLVAAGSIGTVATQDMVVTEYNAATGAVNGSFGSGGAAVHSFPPGPSNLFGVALQPDGSTVVAGVPNHNGGVALLQLLGPTIVMANLGTVHVTADGPLTINFPVALTEPLYTSLPVILCAPAGGVVDGQSGCGTVTFPTGVTRVTVPVTIDITNPPGNQQTVLLDTAGANGVRSNPTFPLGIVVVEHVPPPQPFVGYRLVASDGGIFDFGTSPFLGSTGGLNLAKPVVAMAAQPHGFGYWMAASDGGVFTFGAGFYGSTGGIHLDQPIVGMATTSDGKGYWLVAADGGIFAFGDARFYGSTGGIRLDQPIVGMAATPDGNGYWLVARDGGIFAFGDARFLGSTGGIHLNAPIVAMAADPGAPGYWMVGSDGGIFTFGAAGFYGSTGGIRLDKPVVGMASTPDGRGYWLVASDGGIFSFGDAPFYGSTGGLHLVKPIVGMAS